MPVTSILRYFQLPSFTTPKSQRIVYETLQAIAKENGAAVLIATHDQLIHEFATAIYQLKAGKLTRI